MKKMMNNVTPTLQQIIMLKDLLNLTSLISIFDTLQLESSYPRKLYIIYYPNNTELAQCISRTIGALINACWRWSRHT